MQVSFVYKLGHAISSPKNGQKGRFFNTNDKEWRR